MIGHAFLPPGHAAWANSTGAGLEYVSPSSTPPCTSSPSPISRLRRSRKMLLHLAAPNSGISVIASARAKVTVFPRHERFVSSGTQAARMMRGGCTVIRSRSIDDQVDLSSGTHKTSPRVKATVAKVPGRGTKPIGLAHPISPRRLSGSDQEGGLKN
jgi:hypothetical protein